MKVLLLFLITMIFSWLIYAALSSNKTGLRTRVVEGLDPSGSYKLIKYGGNSSDDLSTCAILVREQAGYNFDIFKLAYEYRTLPSLSADRAYEMAKEFVSRHPDFARTELRGIIGPEGSFVGYELRPLYRKTTFGTDDILTTKYLLKKEKGIEVRIEVDAAAKQRATGG